MNTILLIFFALPILVIVISIALQRLLKCPCLVAGIVFAISLVAIFIISNLNFLVAGIVYTIISFITAILVEFICNYQGRNRRTNDSLTISENAFVNVNENTNTNGGCCCQNQSNNGVNARIDVIPNPNTNGRTGCVYGNYRRR